MILNYSSKVGAVFSGPGCTAKYPPERGGECWRARRCHTTKVRLSIRQRHFSLHSTDTFDVFSLFPFVVAFVFITKLLLKHKHSFIFCVCFLSLRLRGYRLGKIMQRRPADQWVRCTVLFLLLCKKPNAPYRCLFFLIWLSCFVLSRSTQRDSAAEMDSTESPRHQTPAHVCYGQ